MTPTLEYDIIVTAMGLKGAASHRTYERMVETWLDPNERIPTEDECVAKWNELIESGFFEPPYHVKRLEAYQNAGIDMQKTIELCMEYQLGIATNDMDAVSKYRAQLADIHAKRTAIKAQFPKG
jgi:hypothetical protein